MINDMEQQDTYERDSSVDGNLRELVTKFRDAIEKARDEGEFSSEISFCHFPRGCCGDTSDLLAQYLLENGYQSTYVWGEHFYDDPEEGPQSHGWLIVNGAIVDITGDQFKCCSVYFNNNKRVYIGPEDAFYDLFEVEDRNIIPLPNGIRTHYEDCWPRLFGLYHKIMKYI